jgi:hypothetical protein
MIPTAWRLTLEIGRFHRCGLTSVDREARMRAHTSGREPSLDATLQMSCLRLPSNVRICDTCNGVWWLSSRQKNFRWRVETSFGLAFSILTVSLN